MERHGIAESPIGASIHYVPNILPGTSNPTLDSSDQQAQQVQIVGVVPYLGPDDAESNRTPRIYRPIAQGDDNGFRVIARLNSGTDIQNGELEQRIKVASSAVDRDVSIYNLEFLSETAARQYALISLLASAFGSVALGALVLASVGLYGLVSRAVIARRSEMGVRRAIGSTDFGVISIFIRQGMKFLSIGIILGGGLALLIVNLLGSTPFGPSLFSVIDTVFVLVTIVVAAMVMLASYVPATKVIALEPGEALHYE